MISPAEQVKRAVRKRVLVAILLFGALSAMAVGLAVLKNKPFYEAEGYVEVRPNKPRILYRTYENENAQSYNSFIETQMTMLRSREVLTECVEDATVKRLPCVLDDVADPIRGLREALQVKRVGGTQLVSVYLKDETPQGTAYTVNLVLDKYMTRFKADESRAEQDKKRLLEEERKKLRSDIETKQEALAKLREEVASDPNTAPAATSARDPVSTTLDAVINAKALQATLDAKINALQDTLESDGISLPDSSIEGALDNDPEIVRLNAVDTYLRQALIAAQAEAASPSPDLVQQRVNAEPEIGSLKGEMGRRELEVTMMAESLAADNPSLKKSKGALEAIRARLAKIEGDAAQRVASQIKQNAGQRLTDLQKQLLAVQEQMKQLRESARTHVVERLKKDWRAQAEQQIKQFKSEMESSKKNEDALAASLKQHVEQRKLYERKAGEMKALEDERNRLSASLQIVEQRIHELDVESGAPGSVRIAALATDPKAPGDYLARRVKHSLAGICGAAVLTIFVLILLERRDDRIWSADDFSQMPGADLLGSLPDGSLLLPSTTEAALVCRDNPNSLFAENVRNVTAGVLYPPDGKPAKTVLVTSAAPGDGKTTLAVNLAVCIASLNKRVLLVDANFRKPDIARIFDLGNIPGLGDLLAYPEEPTQAMNQIGGTSLAVLTAGTAPGQSGLLGSSRMRELLQKFGSEHDYVIIDAPPLMLADARVLAPMVDGVVCSFRALASKRSTVDSSIATLRRLGARTIGIALTGVNPKYDGFGATMKALSAYTERPSLPEKT